MEDMLLGLYGSDEFEPWTAEPDLFLYERARGHDVLILPTASYADGEVTFKNLALKGLKHFAELGLPVKVAPIRTRDDASDPDICRAIAGARMLFVANGDPHYLAETIVGSSVERAISVMLSSGGAYAGCGAGACLLGELVPPPFEPGAVDQPYARGLGILARTIVAPRHNTLAHFVCAGLDELAGARSSSLLPIDERAAIVFHRGQRIEFRDAIDVTDVDDELVPS
jgi:cyanophycinase